ncbi:VOC family protein [Actinocorallia lasiicapitis]
MTSPATPKVGNVLYPAQDVAQAVAFYTKGLGLTVKFADGARFAALDGGGTTFALAGEEEDLVGVPAVSFKVEDVPAAVERLVAAGGAVVRAAQEGPHEIRAVLRDPAGNPFVVYAPVQK